jgi:hypothetical protein
MKVILAGSRTIADFNLLVKAINKAYDEEGISITEIISGGAKGVDTLAEQFSEEANIPITVILAQWGIYGKKAGILRNIDMSNSGSEALICLWDGISPGSKHMIDHSHTKRIKSICV